MIRREVGKNRINLICSDGVYIITVGSIIHVQKLNFNFKFSMIVIHPIYTISVEKINLKIKSKRKKVRGQEKIYVTYYRGKN